jgi:hypothetical protein
MGGLKDRLSVDIRCTRPLPVLHRPRPNGVPAEAGSCCFVALIPRDHGALAASRLRGAPSAPGMPCPSLVPSLPFLTTSTVCSACAVQVCCTLQPTMRFVRVPAPSLSIVPASLQFWWIRKTGSRLRRRSRPVQPKLPRGYRRGERTTCGHRGVRPWGGPSVDAPSGRTLARFLGCPRHRVRADRCNPPTFAIGARTLQREVGSDFRLMTPSRADSTGAVALRSVPLVRSSLPRRAWILDPEDESVASRWCDPAFCPMLVWACRST